MAYSFTIARPQNIRQTLAKASKTVRNGGGSFSGDEKEGNFSGSGVSGTYAVDDRLTITIIDKPWYASNSVVEETIRNYFKADETG